MYSRSISRDGEFVLLLKIADRDVSFGVAELFPSTEFYPKTGSELS